MTEPKSQRRSDEVAAILLERVTNGRLRPGDRLPPERELAVELGVSRTVVREAVSMLAGKGVLLSLVGSGLKITAVDSTRASESLSLYLLGNEFEYSDIHQVREVIEVFVAGLAAKNADDEHLAAMELACDELADPELDLQARAVADLQFHRSLAASCGNEIFGVVLDSLHRGLIEVRRHNLVSPEALTEAVSSHRAILHAVRNGDSSGAQTAMAAHLSDVLAFWLSR